MAVHVLPAACVPICAFCPLLTSCDEHRSPFPALITGRMTSYGNLIFAVADGCDKAD